MVHKKRPNYSISITFNTDNQNNRNYNMPQTESQNEEHRTREDGPEYRSAMIQTLRAPETRRLFSPLEKVNKSTPTFNHNYRNSEEELTQLSSSNYRWEVEELEDLPVDYVLVRTNVYVKDSSAQLVATRIFDALKSLSITIDSKGVETKNSLLVEAQHGSKLVICLFGHKDMIVVEIRRQSGCSIQFRDLAGDILRFSKGRGKQQQSVSKRKFCIPSTIPRRSQKVHHEFIKDDIRIAYTMLNSKKTDAHLLALESLDKMTTFDEANDVAAKLILGNCECLKQLLYLLDLYSKDRSPPRIESGYHSILCRNILKTLANSFEAISKIDLAGILSANDHDLKTRSFLSLLLSSLHEASVRPHDAFQAARCMRYLLVSEEVEILLVEMSVMDVILSARSAGFDSHQELEQESNKLMGQLQNAC